jgi:hypothetical protein
MPPSEAKPARRYRNNLAQLESALKNHFRRDNDKKNRADKRVESEEREIDPVQTATTRNPMFQHKTTYYEKPANEIRDAKLAEQSKREQ